MDEIDSIGSARMESGTGNGDSEVQQAGMFALRERRVHVTQEDFEMAVAKVMKKETEKNMSLRKLWK
ncbi:hypothetical protein B296_00020546 [Ensete ventricosum]|uniref:Uncharacterized protein n=1 Tax=Ensete ventricosum TaxID=4639 RepID=A0A426YWJ6_ENSVE|nr:hypothetical protein B296_00020546 [Ensete ventricosum]